MSIVFTMPWLQSSLIGVGAAALVLGAPVAEPVCAKMAPDQHRCGDTGQAPGGLAQMIAASTATSSGTDLVVIEDQTLGEERKVLPPEHTKFRLFQDLRPNPKADL